MKKMILLTAILCTALLCGCNGGNQSSTQETTAAATAATQAPAATGPTAAAAEKQAPNLNEMSDMIISEADAKTLVLMDAGLKEADVTFKECKQELDDGVQVYEIEFISGNTEYEYKLNAISGEIIKKEKEAAND